MRHYLLGELSDNSKIPMEGRLHNPGLYAPTISEILVGPLLRCLDGELIWQPEHDGPGSDYRVNYPDGVLLAEVKRLSRSQRVAEEEARRVQKSMEEQADDEVQQPSRIFSDDEERANTRQDAMRLYPHVRKAARQLETSARNAVGNEWQSVPGILFLDVQGNSYVTNVIPWLERWLTYPWARAIDLVVFFDYRPRDGEWGLVADSFSLSRTDRALRILTNALPQCEHGHFHVPACPPGKCDQPFGF